MGNEAGARSCDFGSPASGPVDWFLEDVPFEHLVVHEVKVVPLAVEEVPQLYVPDISAGLRPVAVVVREQHSPAGEEVCGEKSLCSGSFRVLLLGVVTANITAKGKCGVGLSGRFMRKEQMRTHLGRRGRFSEGGLEDGSTSSASRIEFSIGLNG
eukprot:425865-Prorocentrum_minimum.AAC.1